MKVPPKRKGNTLSADLSPVGLRPSMKVPPKRKGNLGVLVAAWFTLSPSMKVPPKRKGNQVRVTGTRIIVPLNESPSEKEGKCAGWRHGVPPCRYPSMKVPPKRKGNDSAVAFMRSLMGPSMKVPPKRKGNTHSSPWPSRHHPLNESPSEKEGKWNAGAMRCLPYSNPQ